MQIIKHDDPRLIFEGAISIERTEEWSCPWRIPFEDRDLYFGKLLTRAVMPSGVRLTFYTDSKNISGTVTPMPDMSKMDIYINGKFFRNMLMANSSEFAFSDLPKGKKLIELWLPQWEAFQLRELRIDDNASLEKYKDLRKRWIAYGSSITHCRTADSPSYTWPAIIAREKNLHLTSLGFAGQCHADPMIARLIRDLPADFISICVGINVYGSTSMGRRAFGAAIIGMIKTIRDGHPSLPLVVISPILSPPRETVPNGAGVTLEMLREITEASVNALQAHGDGKLYYVNGLDIFGHDLAEHMPDNCHPNAAGYKIIADNFKKLVADKYFISD